MSIDLYYLDGVVPHDQLLVTLVVDNLGMSKPGLIREGMPMSLRRCLRTAFKVEDKLDRSQVDVDFVIFNLFQ